MQSDAGSGFCFTLICFVAGVAIQWCDWFIAFTRRRRKASLEIGYSQASSLSAFQGIKW